MKGRSPTPINYGPEVQQRSRMPLPPTPGQGVPATLTVQQQQQQQQQQQAPIPAQQRCEACIRCLQDLRRQVLLLSVPNPRNRDLMLISENAQQSQQQQSLLTTALVQQLRVSSQGHRYMDRGQCVRCGTAAQQLKMEAAQSPTPGGGSSASSSSPGIYPPGTSGSSQRSGSSPKHVTFAGSLSNKLLRQSASASPTGSYSAPHQQMQQQQPDLAMSTHQQQQHQQQQQYHSLPEHHGFAHSPRSSSSSSLRQQQVSSSSLQQQSSQPQSPSAMRRKRQPSQQQQQPRFGTRFSDCLRAGLPPMPMELAAGGAASGGQSGAVPALGKVKVVVKVVSKDPSAPTNVAVDSRRGQVTVFDTTPQHHRGSQGVHKVPKMFAYDSVFTEENSLPELCASALPDIIQGVVNGTDGCVFVFGYGSLGKTHTMLGSDVSPASLGVIPCAISWLFHLIQEQKTQTATARFSVRVSAVEVHGRDESLRDLLADVGRTAADPPPPPAAPYLREDPISGAQLENQSELRAPTAEKAASYLDAALNCRSQARDGMSHLLFTLHLYQYRVERSGAGRGVAGGRSRLHLIDLGSGRTSRDSGHPALSLAALGSVLMSLVNGQRHIPHRDSKLSQLLREALGSLACRACMICQVSSDAQHSTESLQILQLANKIQKLRRRRAKLASNSSDSSSCDSFGVRRAGRLRPQMGLVASAASRLNAVTSQSEADYSSSSEQSCDTVIFIGRNGELTDNERPPPALMRKLAQAASSGEDSDTGTENSGGGGRRVPRTNARARPSLGGRLVGRMTAVEALSTQREQWIDGPNARDFSNAADAAPLPAAPTVTQATPVHVVEAPRKPLPQEPPEVVERWIDGPNASPPSTEERRHSANSALQAHSLETASICEELIQPPSQPQRKDAETQSDEPYESESSASTYSTMDRENQRVLSDISERTEETSGRSGQDGEEEDESSVKSVEAATTSRDVGEQAGGGAVDDEDETNNEALERVEIPSHVAPPPAFIGASATADRVKPQLLQQQQLQPQQLQQQQQQQQLHQPPQQRSPNTRLASSLPRQLRRSDAQPPSPQVATAAPTDPLVARVKPFVRDWVEKHSAMSSSESSSCGCCCCADEAEGGAGSKTDCKHQQQQQQQRQSQPQHPQLQTQLQQVQQCQSARSSPVHTLRRSGHADRPACNSLQATPTHHQHLSQSQPQPQTPHQHQHRSRSSRRAQSQQPQQPPPLHARVAQWLEGVQPDDRCRAVAAAAAAAAATSTPPMPAAASAAPCIPMATTVAKDAGVFKDIAATATTNSGSIKKTSRLASFLTSPLFGKRTSKSSSTPSSATAVLASAHIGTSATTPSPRRRRGDGSTGSKAPSPPAPTPPVAPTSPAHVIPSPYHTVTQPRISVHSSSGHGSDCSSYNPLAHQGGLAGTGLRRQIRCVTGGASSGYESMLRDSEASSCHDTASERSLPAVAKAAAAAAAAAGAGRSGRKKSSHHHRKSGSRSRSRSQTAADDADLLAPEAELAEMERQIRCEKVTELLWQQDQLKKELMEAKSLLMADRAGWNFDLHVADSMDPESAGFMEALRKETSILRKRVHACKSHLMFISCFDAKTSTEI